MLDIVLLEIIPKVETPIIIETLTRMGIANKKERILYPSCYLYKDIDARYYICHFKELFLMRMSQSGYSNITEDDINRRNSIAMLLCNWNLIEMDDIDVETIFVYTLPFYEKSKWIIKHKFNLETL